MVITARDDMLSVKCIAKCGAVIPLSRPDKATNKYYIHMYSDLEHAMRFWYLSHMRKTILKT